MWKNATLLLLQTNLNLYFHLISYLKWCNHYVSGQINSFAEIFLLMKKGNVSPVKLYVNNFMTLQTCKPEIKLHVLKELLNRIFFSFEKFLYVIISVGRRKVVFPYTYFRKSDKNFHFPRISFHEWCKSIYLNGI